MEVEKDLMNILPLLIIVVIIFVLILHCYILNINACIICGNKSKYIIKDTTKEYSICKECKNKYSIVSAQDVRRVKKYFELEEDE